VNELTPKEREAIRLALRLVLDNDLLLDDHPQKPDMESAAKKFRVKKDKKNGNDDAHVALLQELRGIVRCEFNELLNTSIHENILLSS
jgi:hypothetical protein